MALMMAEAGGILGLGMAAMIQGTYRRWAPLCYDIAGGTYERYLSH
jgi:hypothetical protein